MSDSAYDRAERASIRHNAALDSIQRHAASLGYSVVNLKIAPLPAEGVARRPEPGEDWVR